jgi:hypothetical protein
VTKKKRTIWLLGPQYHAPSLGERFKELALPDGPIAVVTAGWQEREGEDEELDTYLDGRSLDLELYRRADHVFRSDPEFREAHRDMQRTLREVEGLYDLRLSFVVESVRRLLVAEGHQELIEPEQDHAIQQLRELDAWHLQRIVEIRTEFEQKFKPMERDAIANEREAVKTLLAKAPAVVITGGHVAVLLNRLRLFGMKELLEGKTVVAWSAGAMVLTERVVLFHDHPPQGPGNPEVVEEGLGLCPGIVALPDGRKRLDLKDRHGVAAFARRFLPDACIVLGDGDCISWDGKVWSAHDEVARLAPAGEVETVTSW